MNFKSLIGIGVLTVAAACTKTETVPVPAQEENRILSYKITSVPDGAAPVVGAVDETDSTITVYLSSNYGLEVMLPEITVPAGATVTPASGTVVTNLLSMLRKDSTINYTVTAKDKSKRTYKLHVKTLQPATKIDELTTDPAKPLLVALYPKYGDNGYAVITLKGQNILTHKRPSLINLILTDSANNQVVLSNTNMGTASTWVSTSVSYQIYPSDSVVVKKLVDNAKYKVTFVNYGEVITLQNPIQFGIR